MVKRLLLDIETAPKIAYVWKFWQENVSAKQVLEHGHLMSFAAKWYDENDIMYMENRKEDDEAIIKVLIELLDQADIVIAHNAKGFDVPQIKGRALVHGLKPPSPFRVVDTYRIAKKQFNFPSNSLEYLCNVLNLSVKKGGHKKFPGFSLWLECLRGNDEAWAELKEYNIIDVQALEGLYDALLPWDSTHPQVHGVEPVGPLPASLEVYCNKCGSNHTQWRGYVHTNTGKYHKYQCNSCGGWGRTRYTLNNKDESLLVNIT